MEKKFYWIKLRTDFFSREEIDFMLSQQNGCEYVVLYQMLCLNTANNGGRLETKLNEVIIPYDIQKIVRDCKYFDYDTVAMALELYKRLGLIYEDNDNVLKLADFTQIVGSESATKEAIRKRNYRAKIKADDERDKVGTNCPIEIRDKRLDIRDKILDNNINNNININNIKEKNKKEKFFENEEVNSVFYEFLDVRKKIKAVNSERAIKTLINKLNKYDDKTKIKMIERSIVNSWKDVYELKENNKKISAIDRFNSTLDEWAKLQEMEDKKNDHNGS